MEYSDKAHLKLLLGVLERTQRSRHTEKLGGFRKDIQGVFIIVFWRIWVFGHCHRELLLLLTTFVN